MTNCNTSRWNNSSWCPRGNPCSLSRCCQRNTFVTRCTSLCIYDTSRLPEAQRHTCKFPLDSSVSHPARLYSPPPHHSNPQHGNSCAIHHTPQNLRWLVEVSRSVLLNTKEIKNIGLIFLRQLIVYILFTCTCICLLWDFAGRVE